MMTESNYESTEITTPVTTMEVIGKVARALYAFGKPAGYKELATMVGVVPQYASQTLSALKDLGIIEPTSDRGKYVLSENGTSFARLLGFGKDKESREVIRNLVLTEGPWSEIVSFLKMNEGAAREPLDLVLHAETRLGKRWASTMRSRIAASYKSILKFAGLIRIEGGLIISLIGMDNSEEPVHHEESVIERDTSPVTKGPDLQYSISTRSTSTAKDYAKFSIPDYFIVHVKRSLTALSFLKEQLRESSVMIPWLKTLEEEINQKEENDT